MYYSSILQNETLIKIGIILLLLVIFFLVLHAIYMWFLPFNVKDILEEIKLIKNKQIITEQKILESNTEIINQLKEINKNLTELKEKQ